MKKPTTFEITEDRNFDEEAESEMQDESIIAVDPALYSMLKDLRKTLSKELEVPPYVISR